MSGLGHLIRLLRENAALTREELAEGVCSSKYIYLIEKGARIPAAKLMDELGTKLGVDLFEYTYYLDCEEPLMVKKTVVFMETLRHEHRFDELMQLNHQVHGMNDFKKVSLKHEVEYNRLIINLFVNKRFAEVLTGLEAQIISLGGQIPISEKTLTPALSKFYNLYIITLFLLDRNNEGTINCTTFYRMLYKVRFIKYYQDLYISVALNYVNILLDQNEIELGHQIIDTLKRYQLETKRIDRLHLSYFHLAVIVQRMGDQHLSESHYLKFLYLGLSLNKKTDIVNLIDYGVYDLSKLQSTQVEMILQDEGIHV